MANREFKAEAGALPTVGWERLASFSVLRVRGEALRVCEMFLIRRRLLKDRARFGRWGERYCERFLRNKGLRTLTRNYACKVGELDLVMVDADGTIVFVEVRSRAGEEFVPVEATVTPAKRTRVSRAARYFLAVHKIEDRPLRFDVVALVLGRQGPPQIRHHENAFVP